MPAPRLDRSRLEVAALDGSTALPPFLSGDDDLDGFLRDDAARLQDAGVTRVYLAWYESELVGYAALLSDSMQLKTNDVKRLRPLAHDDSHVIPAVKLGRLAVSLAFRARIAGCGTALVRFVAAVAESVAESVGCRLLTVDAYRDSVEFYRRLGFSMRKSDVEDVSRNTIPMWLDLQACHPWRNLD